MLMNRWLEGRTQVQDELGIPDTSGRTHDHSTPVALSWLAPGSMWKPLSWEGTRRELNLPCRWEGRVLPGW